jgi:hypothetical protein
MRLVPDWREWHRWWSMRWTIATVAIAAVPASYAVLPADWLPAIPDYVKAGLALLTVFTGMATAVSRVMVQTPKDPPP